MAWAVEVTGEFAAWTRELRKLDRESSRQVGAAVELLKQHGPSLKRTAIPRAEQLYAEHIEATGSRRDGGR